jgi:hypothetical protein
VKIAGTVVAMKSCRHRRRAAHSREKSL